MEEAFALRDLDPGAVLVGEVGGRHIPGFDLNNSPTLMADSDVAGRRLIQRTGAGTQAVIAATGADERVLGSLVVAGATARYVRSRAPRKISLVATNSDTGPPNEDDACARYLAALLHDEPAEAEAAIADVRASALERLLVERLGDDFPATDVELATALDRFAFTMVVTQVDLGGGGVANWVTRPVDA